MGVCPSRLKKMYSKISAAFGLVAAGILFRTVFHIGDNIETITSGTLVAAAYLGPFWALAVPLTSMAVSDLILGNSLIFIFTWTAYMIIGATAFLFFRKKKKDRLIIPSILAAGGASIFFYLWTNFGVWFLDFYGMYPKNLPGLIEAYILGLPFLKMNFLGNLIFVPLFFFIAQIIRAEAKEENKNKIFSG